MILIANVVAFRTILGDNSSSFWHVDVAVICRCRRSPLVKLGTIMPALAIEEMDHDTRLFNSSSARKSSLAKGADSATTSSYFRSFVVLDVTLGFSPLVHPRDKLEPMVDTI
jgi:hypothetical protein